MFSYTLARVLLARCEGNVSVPCSWLHSGHRALCPECTKRTPRSKDQGTPAASVPNSMEMGQLIDLTKNVNSWKQTWKSEKGPCTELRTECSRQREHCKGLEGLLPLHFVNIPWCTRARGFWRYVTRHGTRQSWAMQLRMSLILVVYQSVCVNCWNTQPSLSLVSFSSHFISSFSY